MEKDQSGETKINHKLFAARKKSKMCPSSSKNCMSRKRNDLTIDRKLKIIEEFTNGVQINAILKRYNINQSHLSSIIRRKAAILQDFHTYGRKQRKRIAKRTKYAPINEEVFRWLMSLNCHVSGSIIQNKAKFFAEKLNITGFRASNGWLECFRKKYTIQPMKDFPTTPTNGTPSQHSQLAESVTSPSLNNNSSPHLLNSSTSTVMDESIVSAAIDNGGGEYGTTSGSNDSIVSSMHSKSPNHCVRPSIHSSNGCKDNMGGGYHDFYHQSNCQVMSPLLTTPMGSPGVPPPNITNDCYNVENANPNNQMNNFTPKLIQPILSSSASYHHHSMGSENLPMPMPHAYNKPLHQSNLENVHDIYGYSASLFPKNNHFGDYTPTISAYHHRLNHNHHPYQNQNVPNDVLNMTPSSFECNHVFYPFDQIHPIKNEFAQSTTPTPTPMHMKPYVEFNDIMPNVPMNGHFQQPPPTMHESYHSPVMNNWSDPLATLPSSYSLDMNNPNPPAPYTRSACTNDNSSSMAYTYNHHHMTRNHPTYHPNQHKDF